MRIIKIYNKDFLITFILKVAETVGGWLANSIAIMSDAAHLLSDLTSFLVSLVAIYLAMRPASKKMNYGYQRAGRPIIFNTFTNTSYNEHLF